MPPWPATVKLTELPAFTVWFTGWVLMEKFVLTVKVASVLVAV